MLPNAVGRDLSASSRGIVEMLSKKPSFAQDLHRRSILTAAPRSGLPSTTPCAISFESVDIESLRPCSSGALAASFEFDPRIFSNEPLHPQLSVPKMVGGGADRAFNRPAVCVKRIAHRRNFQHALLSEDTSMGIEASPLHPRLAA
jgi:hypothetical protein